MRAHGTTPVRVLAIAALAVACGGHARKPPPPEPVLLMAPPPPPMLMMEARAPEEFTVIEDPQEPYLQRLVAQLRAGWRRPDLDVHPTAALACVKLDADGEITAARLKDSTGEPTVDDSIEDALFELRRARHDAPEAPPAEVVDEAARAWLCFRLKLD